MLSVNVNAASTGAKGVVIITYDLKVFQLQESFGLLLFNSSKAYPMVTVEISVMSVLE